MEQLAKNPGKPWQIALALLFALFLIGMAASIVTAARRVSRVVDSDYYSHGLHYGKTRSGSPNAGLCWTISASVAADELRVRVSDRQGAPVAGGRLTFHPETGGAPAAATWSLSEEAPGVFRAPRPRPPQGELHGTLLFTRGEEAASQKLVVFN